MSNKLFEPSAGDDAGKGWFLCWTGTSQEDSQDWNVEIRGRHADEVPLVLQDAKGTAELIACLLNEWYETELAKRQEVENQT